MAQRDPLTLLFSRLGEHGGWQVVIAITRQDSCSKCIRVIVDGDPRSLLRPASLGLAQTASDSSPDTPPCLDRVSSSFVRHFSSEPRHSSRLRFFRSSLHALERSFSLSLHLDLDSFRIITVHTYVRDSRGTREYPHEHSMSRQAVSRKRVRMIQILSEKNFFNKVSRELDFLEIYVH